jgi:hypothetical protein
MSWIWNYGGLFHHELYWSFGVYIQASDPALPSFNWYFQNAYYFQDYWSKASYMGPAIPIMFVAQILTLFASLASFFISKKRMIGLVPVLVCPLIIASIFYLVTIFPMNRTLTSPSYGLGFWLTFASFFLFLAVFIMNHRLEKNTASPINADTKP